MQQIDTILKECGCLPFSFISSKKVKMFPWQKKVQELHSSIIALIQAPLCTPNLLSCVHNVTVDTSMCVHKCNGMMLTSFFKSDFDAKIKSYIPLEITAYKKYKKRFKPKTSSPIKGTYIPLFHNIYEPNAVWWPIRPRGCHFF